MVEFYRFPHWFMITLVMVVGLCIVLQTMVISYSFRRLNTGWARRAENWMECAILAVLFLFAAMLAQVQYGLYCGFLETSDYGFARQMAFLAAAVLGTAAAVGTEIIWPFFVMGGAAILMPVTEKVTGKFYPIFFIVSIVFFLLRGIHVCIIRRRELYTRLSSISVKEAIDTMNTGLLFFRPGGDILLCNSRMDELTRQMTGKPLRSGKELLSILDSGKLYGGCEREILGRQQVFRFPDSSVWSISAHDILVKSRKYVLLTADDVTERWNAVTLLDRQNKALEKRGQELRYTIEHLQTICEAEEIARSKGKVHDILGQRISLLLRALRYDRQPDETLLMDFIKNLPTAFTDDTVPSPAHRLEMLKETFKGMDVAVEIRGSLPDNEIVADSFAQIAVECVTNAVRHGYATVIQFHFFHNDCWRMTVSDNGIPPGEPIREGGGIGEMRRRVSRLGGTMELYTVPRFNIQIAVPKEAEQK